MRLNTQCGYGIRNGSFQGMGLSDAAGNGSGTRESLLRLSGFFISDALAGQ